LRANKRGYAACPVKTVPAGDIETAVLQQLHRIFQSPEVLAGTARALAAREAEQVARIKAEKDSSEAELRVVKTSAANLIQAARNGVGFVGEELTRLDGQRADLEARIRGLEGHLRFYATNPPTPELVTEEIARLDRIWEALVPAEQERIVQLLVEQVLVYPDRVEIALRADGLHSLASEMNPKEERDAK
jgi:hypothetical protein